MITSHRPSCYLRLSLALLICLIPFTPVNATLTIAPFKVNYIINRNGMDLVDMRRSLIKTGPDTYQFLSTSKATSNISWLIRDRIKEQSLFTLQQPLRPLSYQYEQKGGRKTQQTELLFDWSNKTVIDTLKNKAKPVSIPTGTSDKLLYQLQIMVDLAAGKRELNYTIAEKGRVHHYQFKHIGNETLKLSIGVYDTIILQRDTGKRSTTIWCAPALDYLPVRIEHKEKDGSRMQANAVSFIGLPFAPLNPTTTALNDKPDQ